MNNYDERLKDCLEKALELEKKDVKKIDMDTPLQDLGINSMLFMKIVVAIENEFDFEFQNENLDYSKFQTYGDILKFIEDEIGGKS